MKKNSRGIVYGINKVFFTLNPKDGLIQYSEGIAYVTDLKKALHEKAKHPGSFIFPLYCTFYKDRRRHKHLIRANFSRGLEKKA